MAAGQYVVLGLARPQAPWFSDVARWSNSAALPVDFVMVLSCEELCARLRSGRVFSAVIVDAGIPGCDRDVFDLASSVGCAVLVVEDPVARRPWEELGADIVLSSSPSRREVRAALEAAAQPVARLDEVELLVAPAPPTTGSLDRGALIAVTGTGGTGQSTVAMTIAAGLAASDPVDSRCVLADCALRAQQALLHDAGDVVPGLSELVEACRTGDLEAEQVRGLCFEVADRGYDLLLGLRRQRDWAALRPRAVAAAVDALRRAYGMVVAEVEPDVEGEAECGSQDVQERNSLARTVMGASDLVLVVGHAGLGGLHSMLRVLRDVHDLGVDPGRLVPVINRAPRNPRARAELTRGLVSLLERAVPNVELASPPVYVPERRRLDELLRDGAGPPGGFATQLAAAVIVLLGRAPMARSQAADMAEPVMVQPGSLGSWALTPEASP